MLLGTKPGPLRHIRDIFIGLPCMVPHIHYKHLTPTQCSGDCHHLPVNLLTVKFIYLIKLLTLMLNPHYQLVDQR
jgi:hypothetical protein